MNVCVHVGVCMWGDGEQEGKRKVWGKKRKECGF